MTNPLLWLIKESRRLGDTPYEALEKLVFVISLHAEVGLNVYETRNILVGWMLENGEPTYESLHAWCEEFAGADENSVVMDRLRQSHDKTVESLTDEEYFAAFGENRDGTTQ